VGGRWVGAFFFALCGVVQPAVADGAASAAAAADIAPQVALDSGRPDVAPWLLPDDWFGRPPAKTRERAWQQHKSARVAMFSSFLVPGLGQLYNEREFWALVAAGTEFYFIGTMVAEQRQTNYWREVVNATGDEFADVQFRLHRDNRTQATWLFALTALLSGLQSYVDAHMSDFDDSPLPLRTTFLQGQGPAAEMRLKF